MRRTRQIIAVTLLTTALCADGQALSAPVSDAAPASPPLARTACQIASRFSRTFHRDAPRVALMRDERPVVAAAGSLGELRLTASLPARPHPAELRAEHFRLPPPQA